MLITLIIFAYLLLGAIYTGFCLFVAYPISHVFRDKLPKSAKDLDFDITSPGLILITAVLWPIDISVNIWNIIVAVLMPAINATQEYVVKLLENIKKGGE